MHHHPKPYNPIQKAKRNKQNQYKTLENMRKQWKPIENNAKRSKTLGKTKKNNKTKQTKTTIRDCGFFGGLGFGLWDHSFGLFVFFVFFVFPMVFEGFALGELWFLWFVWFCLGFWLVPLQTVLF
jgi:hypothetical protein